AFRFQDLHDEVALGNHGNQRVFQVRLDGAVGAAAEVGLGTVTTSGGIGIVLDVDRVHVQLGQLLAAAFGDVPPEVKNEALVAEQGRVITGQQGVLGQAFEPLYGQGRGSAEFRHLLPGAEQRRIPVFRNPAIL